MSEVERASGQLAELIGASRDLALLLGDGQSMGDLGLSARDGRVELEVPAARLFAEASDALIVNAAPVLAAVARAAGAQHPLSVVLHAPGDSEPHKKRAQALLQALVERGVVKDRCSVELTPGADVPAAAATPAGAPNGAPPATPAPAPASAPAP